MPMQLTPLQLEIQQRADKTLSFGCIVELAYSESKIVQGVFIAKLRQFSYLNEVSFKSHYRRRIPSRYMSNKIIKVIGHPMNWGRLCYLRNSYKIDAKSSEALIKVEVRFIRNKDSLQQTVLERPIELQKLVLSFLKTLGTN